MIEPNDVVGSMDAELWAKFFMQTYHQNPSILCEEVMMVWFANAIMSGYDKARLEQMFKDAGVENMEQYVDWMMQNA